MEFLDQTFAFALAHPFTTILCLHFSLVVFKILIDLNSLRIVAYATSLVDSTLGRPIYENSVLKDAKLNVFAMVLFFSFLYVVLLYGFFSFDGRRRRKAVRVTTPFKLFTANSPIFYAELTISDAARRSAVISCLKRVSSELKLIAKEDA